MPAMLQPGMGNLPPVDQPWAADNGRYAAPEKYTDERYLTWLSKRPGQDRCLFATAPDTFGDAEATLRDSIPLLPRIRALGYRAALVAQPVLSPDAVPWDLIDALFVGGPNSWQHSDPLIDLVAEAKRRGLWVHMGRVNSLRRMEYAASIGCDSADGTKLKFGPADVQGWAQHVRDNTSLWRPA